MYGSASELVREALRDFFENLAGSKLVDMNELRQEMQARRQRAFNNLDQLQGVEEVFKELSDKHELEA
jgi:Arc/MetJ-type ribon-helix-helix transcriptional regulator